jgi:hypothetical protein
MVREALKASRGNQAVAAEAIGCTRSAICQFIRDKPALREAVADYREKLLDLAEDRLYELVDAGNLGAITLALKTVGKSRGYSERVEHAVGGPLLITELIIESPEELKAIEAVNVRQIANQPTDIVASESVQEDAADEPRKTLWQKLTDQ